MRGNRARADVVEEAERTGLAALVFLTEDEDRLGKFLGDTGLSPDDLRASAGTSEGLVAVLDYLLSDESLLMVFAAGAGFDPSRIGPSRDVLAGGNNALGYDSAHGMAGRSPAGMAQQQPKRPSKRWAGPGA